MQAAINAHTDPQRPVTTAPVHRMDFYDRTRQCFAVVQLAAGESVIKCSSPLNVLKDTYDHSCY